MNLLSPAFVGAIRRSLAHQGDRRRAQMKVGHPAFVGGFRESHHSRLSGKLYSLISIDSLSTFCGEDQRAAQGILFELLDHQATQTIEAFTHVRRA
jgi:hypothetical protein